MTIACAVVLTTAALGATAYAKDGSRSEGAAFGARSSGGLVSSTTKATGAASPSVTATPSASEATATAATAAAPQVTASGTSTTSAAAAQVAQSSVQMSVSDPLTGEPFSGIPQVGALFDTSDGALTSHHCTGSVVASPEGDIVVTAAHCVYGSSDIAFVPGYDNGREPYGVWIASSVVVAPEWIADRDPDYDVAFIVVHKSGSTEPIQDVVGADTLAVDQSFTALTQVVGYPSDTNQPITCTNYTSEFSATQLEFDCDGYPGGTSGSPFLTDVDSATGLGSVVGVIGGYETGGYSPNVSYSVHFTGAVTQLLAQAEAQG